MGSPGGSVVKNPPANAGDSRVQSLGGEDPLEKETRSSILAWNIPWTGDPGRLQFRGLQRVRPDKHIHTHTETGISNGEWPFFMLGNKEPETRDFFLVSVF